jgi:hypothetical protein
MKILRFSIKTGYDENTCVGILVDVDGRLEKNCENVIFRGPRSLRYCVGRTLGGTTNILFFIFLDCQGKEFISLCAAQTNFEKPSLRSLTTSCGTTRRRWSSKILLGLLRLH